MSLVLTLTHKEPIHLLTEDRSFHLTLELSVTNRAVTVIDNVCPQYSDAEWLLNDGVSLISNDEVNGQPFIVQSDGFTSWGALRLVMDLPDEVEAVRHSKLDKWEFGRKRKGSEGK